MNRRAAILALIALGTAPGSVNAQPAPRRLAWIGEGSAHGGSTYVQDRQDSLALLRDSLRENGLADGKDYVLEAYWADGKYDRFPALVAAAIEREPSVILVATVAAVRAAQQATKTIPIVFVGTNDPVGSGLVASLARPGGNTTGYTAMNFDKAAKQVELLREALPKSKRLAVLINPLNPTNRTIFQTVRTAAVRLGMTAEAFEADAPERIGGAFAALSKFRPDALLTGFDAMINTKRAQIGSLSLASKIPVVTGSLTWSNVDAVLFCYGTPTGAMLGRIAFYIKQILAGAKPADLPVEQATRFELVVNLKSAGALGLTIPRAFLLRADRVIE